jgi:hypothetical protein
LFHQILQETDSLPEGGVLHLQVGSLNDFYGVERLLDDRLDIQVRGWRCYVGQIDATGRVDDLGWDAKIAGE